MKTFRSASRGKLGSDQDKCLKRSESITVGSLAYVEAIQKKLGVKAKSKEILQADAGFQLRETEAAYRDHSRGEMGPLSPENSQSAGAIP